jgi:hypothetical protein
MRLIGDLGRCLWDRRAVRRADCRNTHRENPFTVSRAPAPDVGPRSLTTLAFETPVVVKARAIYVDFI